MRLDVDCNDIDIKHALGDVKWLKKNHTCEFSLPCH